MSWSRDFVHDGEALRVSASGSGAEREVLVGDRRHAVRVVALPDGRVVLTIDGRQHVASAVRLDRGSVQVRVDGHTWMLPAHTGGRGGGSIDATGEVTAPMTGTVLEVAVAIGDRVTAGDTVAVVTAMKMEHRLTAQIDGEVVEVALAAGSNCDAGALIVRIE
ncbi:MAG: acetyl-CoA carboxylase biotin carboxyl carrier protein subunit [Planctomycetes bacterium]|nr:acetyl-CoA carboxylase biotin carboxyl carrier protein subunit [Planctomycetota bacterium]